METSWSNLCRCCLSADCNVSILDTEQNIKEIFHEITTIKVLDDDGLPHKLCEGCHSLLITAYHFRKRCITMDNELQKQLKVLLSDELYCKEESQDEEIYDDDFANDPVKQLESIIKSEPIDLGDDEDDDCYYVLVIDSQKEDEEEIQTEKTGSLQLKEIKLEPPEETVVQEKIPEHTDQIVEQTDEETFQNSFNIFLMNDSKVPVVPVNVPATILENEEECNYDDSDSMNIEETHETLCQEQDIVNIPIEDMSEVSGQLTEYREDDSNNLIKILTSGNADNTILLKSDDGIQYLTDTQLVTNDGEDGQEVIFCEGDDASQFQILKYDGSELVIEYADDSQIATVLQQDDGSFLCHCGEQFQDLSDYEKHQHKHNPGGDNLCNLCGKGFESAEIITGHMLLHSVTGVTVKCPFCDQLVKRTALTQHIKYGHNNIKPKCSVCMKTFANPNNLKRHMMIHSGIREFECDICFKRFSQKITMQTHRLTHVNQYSCTVCSKSYACADDLETHKNLEDCSKSKVEKVKKELMKTVKQEVTTNLGKLLGYACSLCKKMFSLESALEQHIETVHIVDPLELLCSTCGEVLPSKKDMQIHALSHKNAKKNTKRFECSICNKSCASQAMLLMHERVHTNERPFPCQLCSLRFKTKTHLRTHQLTHTREKKFGCSVCMKFFALKGNLVVHLRTHTGERPYVCSLCNEAFIDSKYLKKHKIKKHSLNNVAWNQY